MNYDPDLIADFARRTLSNLDRIQRAEQEGELGVFPVTQLWNSLLGLIVMPHELAEERIPVTPIGDAWPSGAPLIRESIGECRTLRGLVRSLRNAIAHSNVEFRATNREIVSMKLWNLPPRVPRDAPPDRRTWEAEVAVADIDCLARLIANTYATVFAST